MSSPSRDVIRAAGVVLTRGVGKFATRATVGRRLVAEATMIAMPARGVAPSALA